jgi:UDP-sulfoquinovose synthase
METNMRNILILGIDGFCGWPTSLKLAKEGNNVFGVDNLSRRKIDKELKVSSATPISSIKKRIKSANRLLGTNIQYKNINLQTDYYELLKLIKNNNIDTIIHFAEQKSAPYSMISEKERRFTVDHNISVTNNVLSAIVDSGLDIHLVHLGTMGVYGYSDVFGKVPEGYLDVSVTSTGKDAKILFPTNPGSIYHMTKSLDQILFQFYNKNWGIKITDLHQGIVWGVNTDETILNETLINRFDYDGEYGTVLNRFIAQSAIQHPLTVYGTGGQERGYIHISDSAQCISLSVYNPPETSSKVRIFNQVSEVRSVIEIAELISTKTGVDIKKVTNPRKEMAENKLYVENSGLKGLGFEPKTISDYLLDDILLISKKYKNNIKKDKIYSLAKW